jgi:hypothetical protein
MVGPLSNAVARTLVTNAISRPYPLTTELFTRRPIDIASIYKR